VTPLGTVHVPEEVNSCDSHFGVEGVADQKVLPYVVTIPTPLSPVAIVKISDAPGTIPDDSATTDTVLPETRTASTILRVAGPVSSTVRAPVAGT
jgi:hypothetical protein